MTFLTVAMLVGMTATTATTALAQQGRTELRGRITDAQGGALPGVAILITNQDTGTFREVVTSGDGSYFAAQLLPGTGLSRSLLNFASGGLPVSAPSRLFYATSATAPSGGASASKAPTR